MIENNIVDFQTIFNQQNPMMALLTSTYKFYPTGSRLLKNVSLKRNADWDFYTPYTPEVEDFLKTCMFRKLDSYLSGDTGFAYNDKSLKSVYRMPWDSTHIDVQLIKPQFINAKHRVNQALYGTVDGLKFMASIYKLAPAKEITRNLWRMLMASTLSDNFFKILDINSTSQIE